MKMVSSSVIAFVSWSLTLHVAIAQQGEVDFRELDPLQHDPFDPDWASFKLVGDFEAGNLVIHSFRTNVSEGKVEILASEIQGDRKRWIIFQPGGVYRDLKFSWVEFLPSELNPELEPWLLGEFGMTRAVFEILRTDPPMCLILSNNLRPAGLIVPSSTIKLKTPAKNAE